ncbi:MAG TPA: serine/threonine-protein kinase [Polyangiaceae bacterium]|nr:serine/threonine-protein kinase [Polyangiaceae bacterium]
MHGASNSEGPESTAREGAPGTIADESATPAEPASSARIGDHENVVFPDRYDIKEEIARGGIGRILRAHDLRLDREVALKELHRNDPAVVERFLREIRITAQLQHPNIIPLHEAGRWPNGQPFYAMKLVEGKTFGRAIADAQSLVERLLLLPVLVDVAEALAYAHGQGVMHRDLKPANVLVGPFGETVVIDWGLAKRVDEPDEQFAATPATRGYETTLGVVVGTPAYMPPEQATGRPVDRRADVYSLGAMLYHLIAGRSPYADASDDDILARVRDTTPVSLWRLAPDAPRDLVAIAHKAMARDPDARYPSARELAEELGSYLTGGLVGAYRYTLFELVERFYERRRAIVLTVVAALTALAAFGAESFRRVRTERDGATQSAARADAANKQLEERVDAYIVERARALLDRDPTASIGQLKQPKSMPPGAVTIAAWAEERGVAEQVLHGHVDSATTVAYSPDGSLIATGGNDHRVVLWDTTSWTATELPGHTDRVTKIAFSPNGYVIATGCYDKQVRLFARDGKPGRVLSGHGAAVKALGFSHDSTRLCSIDTDGEVRLWDVATGAFTSRKSTADRDLFCSFSPDGAYVLSGSHGGVIHLWNIATGSVRSLSGHQGSVRSAAFSPDGASIASGGEDGTVRLWSLSGQGSKILGNEGATVQIVAFSPDARRLATAGMNGRVRLWDVATRTSRVVNEHGERVVALAFSEDGRYLASSGWDKIVRVHDLRTEVRTVLRGHGDVVSALSFSPDGTHLASASWDKTVRVWNAHHTHERRALVGHTVGVRTVAFSPDGKLLASGGHDNAVRIWRPDTGESRVLTGHTDHVYKVVFSPDGKWLASSSDDRTVRLWSVAGDAVRVLSGHRDDVEELAFSPDGTRLASASEDHTVRLWPMNDGAPVVLPHDGDVTAVAFDRSSTLLASASRDHTVRLWDAHTGEVRKLLRGHTDEVWDVVFSPDGSRLASASADDSVIVWNVDGSERARLGSLPGAHIVSFSPDGERVAVSGVSPKLWVCQLSQQKCDELTGHSAVVHDLAFLPDGRTLASASGDGTVSLWDLDTHERRVFEGHAAPVFGLTVSPDGRTIASASGDANVRLWAVVRLPRSRPELLGFLDGLSHEHYARGIPEENDDSDGKP